jgi:hypothetical protein
MIYDIGKECWTCSENNKKFKKGIREEIEYSIQTAVCCYHVY